MQILRIGVLLAGVALLVGLTACGSDDKSSSGATSRATTPAGGATNAATGETGATSVQVVAKDFSFDPDSFTVAAGKDVTITLNNQGSATHTLTVYKDEAFTEPVAGADTKNVSGASKGEFTTTFAAGEYYFHCQRHPTQMQGEFEAK
jgi:plastocyanin